MRGSFTQILNYIDDNPKRFSSDTERDKYSIIIFPPHQDKSHYVTYDFETKEMAQSGDTE